MALFARRAPLLLGALAAVALTALLTTTAAPAAAAECPNEIRRQEQGVAALRLPECRAYEDASPNSYPHVSSGGTAVAVQPSIDGDSVAYRSVYPALGEETSGGYYLATRGATGWTRKNIVPQETPSTAGVFTCAQETVFSDDFTKNALQQDYHLYPGANEGYPEGFCETSEAVLDPREVKGFSNLFVHDLSSNSYELVSLNEADGPPGNSQFVAGSDDLSTLVVQSEAQLTSDAPGVTPNVAGGWNLFAWANGHIHLATYLPDGTPVQGVLPPHQGAAVLTHVLSEDGSKLLFTYGGALYMRLNPAQPQSDISGGECTEPAKACTVQVDESQGPGASGGGFFEYASADGSRVFFTDDSKLTTDSTAVSGKEDLYEYETATGKLTDLTVNTSEPADVWAITGASEDGSYLYFVAEAALEGSGAPAPGNCEHFDAGNTCNLYLRHGGTTTYLASLSVDDSLVYKSERHSVSGTTHDGHLMQHHVNAFSSASQASPNGHFFAFETVENINGEGTGSYLYDADADQFNCICATAGEPGSFLDPQQDFRSTLYGWRNNQVLDNGGVLFETNQQLVPADVSPGSDVYLYRNREYHLISSGEAEGNSNLVGANPSGSDVFFITGASLVNSDADGAVNVYDARIDGGFPEPPPLPGCESEACRGAGTNAPAAAATGTAAFRGPGNVVQPHKRNCGATAKRALKVSRAAKRLRGKAKRAHNPKLAKRLRHRSATLAKKSHKLSKSAKSCRRGNRRAGK